MRKFLLRFCLYSVIFFCIALVIWFTSANSLSDSKVVKDKLEFAQKNKDYNTLFIGSSKINNQIIPKVIDSLNVGLKTMNLGANGSFNLENLATLNYILDNNPSQWKVIVLEMQNKIKFTKTNVLTSRSYSALTPDNLRFAMNYHFDNKDYLQVGYTLFSGFIKIITLDRRVSSEDTSENTSDNSISNSGFIALDDDKNPSVIERHNDLLKKPDEIQRRIDAFNNDKKDYQANEALVAKLNELNAKCQRHNIKLVLLFPAPAEPDAESLLAIEKITKVPVINTLDPIKHKELYTFDVRWDYGHLNRKGAQELSTIIGHQLNEILEK